MEPVTLRSIKTDRLMVERIKNYAINGDLPGITPAESSALYYTLDIVSLAMDSIIKEMPNERKGRPRKRRTEISKKDELTDDLLFHLWCGQTSKPAYSILDIANMYSMSEQGVRSRLKKLGLI